MPPKSSLQATIAARRAALRNGGGGGTPEVEIVLDKKKEPSNPYDAMGPAGARKRGGGAALTISPPRNSPGAKNPYRDSPLPQQTVDRGGELRRGLDSAFPPSRGNALEERRQQVKAQRGNPFTVGSDLSTREPPRRATGNSFDDQPVGKGSNGGGASGFTTSYASGPGGPRGNTNQWDDRPAVRGSNITDAQRRNMEANDLDSIATGRPPRTLTAVERRRQQEEEQRRRDEQHRRGGAPNAYSDLEERPIGGGAGANRPGAPGRVPPGRANTSQYGRVQQRTTTTRQQPSMYDLSPELNSRQTQAYGHSRDLRNTNESRWMMFSPRGRAPYHDDRYDDRRDQYARSNNYGGYHGNQPNNNTGGADDGPTLVAILNFFISLITSVVTVVVSLLRAVFVAAGAAWAGRPVDANSGRHSTSRELDLGMTPSPMSRGGSRSRSRSTGRRTKSKSPKRSSRQTVGPKGFPGASDNKKRGPTTSPAVTLIRQVLVGAVSFGFFVSVVILALPLFVTFNRAQDRMVREVPWVLEMRQAFGWQPTTAACARCAYKQALNETLAKLDATALEINRAPAGIRPGSSSAAHFFRHRMALESLEGVARAHHMARHRVRLYGRSRDASWADAVWYPVRDALKYGVYHQGLVEFIGSLLSFDVRGLAIDRPWEVLVCLRQDEKLPCPSFEFVVHKQMLREGITDLTVGDIASGVVTHGAADSKRYAELEQLYREVLLGTIESSWRTNEQYNALCNECYADPDTAAMRHEALGYGGRGEGRRARREAGDASVPRFDGHLEPAN